MNDLENKRFSVKICAGPNAGGNPCIYLSKDFPFQLFMKWQWLFRYRAALYQVQNPKHYVDVTTTKYDFIPPVEMQIKNLTNKITSRKGIITQWQNKVQKWESEWNELFPITDQEFHKKANAKIETAIKEYQQLVQQLNELNK